MADHSRLTIESALPSSLLAFASIIFLPLLAFAASADHDAVAVFVSPARGLKAAFEIVANADGELVGLTRRNILIARSNKPEFAGRLYAAGAWLVLPSFGTGCTGRIPALGYRLPSPTLDDSGITR